MGSYKIVSIEYKQGIIEAYKLTTTTITGRKQITFLTEKEVLKLLKDTLTTLVKGVKDIKDLEKVVEDALGW